jgi:4-amino-4-deoxy-L-arabinose transferase-like glycosyltransferase
MSMNLAGKQMDKKYWVLFSVAAIVYIVYNLATLSYSPLPWFDEVTFMSITDSYMKHHTLYEEMRIVGEPGEKLFYGPIYFIWQSFIIKSFGCSIFNVRISNMLFGFVCLFLVYKIGRKLGFSIKAGLIAMVMMAVEPNFNQFLHSGRMDFISLFFFLLSFLLFLNISGAGKVSAVLLALATGALLGCAILTTPRIIFAFSVYACYFLYEIIVYADKSRMQTLLKFALIGLAFAAVYGYWIYVTFGGINGYIDHATHAPYLKDHVGVGTEFLLRYNIVIYALAYVSFVMLLLKKKLKGNPGVVLFAVPGITAFIFIVSGSVIGRYFALVIPFVSILISGTAFYLYENRLLKYASYAAIASFLAVFIFKSTFVLSTIPQRDPFENEKIITQYIEPNTSVFGDFEFYYIARNKNCSFLTTQMNGSIAQLTKYIVENKIRYVILNEKNDVRQYYETAFLNDYYDLVVKVPDRNPSAFYAGIISKLPYNIADGYSCYIYKYRN